MTNGWHHCTGSTSVRSVGIFHVENTARRYAFDDIQATTSRSPRPAQLADLPSYDPIPIQSTIDPFCAIFLNESVTFLALIRSLLLFSPVLRISLLNNPFKGGRSL